ncbi:diguanylate cyclase [Bacillus sp. APMAM]|nr:diguanylate cyclase [Bacillus sp. APMAM]RTZ57279.1 diguanylate cyclase [Bacillus sp. SAJ1]
MGKFLWSNFREILNIHVNNNNIEFTTSNNILLLTRIRYASIILLFLYIYCFYADFYLYKGIPENSYRLILTCIHLLGFTASIAFLFIHKLFKHDTIYHTVWPTVTINFYIFTYVMGGALASINSQQLNGNIYAYIVILIGVVSLFPVRPRHFFFILFFTHIIFLVGLYYFSDGNKYDFISNQINSTGTAVISFIICFVLYSFRKRDFRNQLIIKNSEQNLLHLFNVNPYPLILTSLDNGKILLANNKALEFYHVTTENVASLDINHFYTNKEERTSIMEELRTHGHLNNYVLEQKTSDGSKKWVLVNYKLIDYMDQKCVLTGTTDITDLKKIEAELEMYATTDMLTGVLNRRKGMEILQEITETSTIPFVLLFIDINNLKQVNDHYGHPEGDYLVKTVCHVIKSRLDNQDIIFRYGGDEFIIAFLDKHTNHAERIWSEIVALLEEENSKKIKPYSISVSHGLFYYNSAQSISLQEIINYADKEMYKEKAIMKGLGDGSLVPDFK